MSLHFATNALEQLQAREDDLAVDVVDPERLELRFVEAEQLAAVYRTAHEQRHVLGQVDVILEPISTAPVGPVLDVALCLVGDTSRCISLEIGESPGPLFVELLLLLKQRGQLPQVRDLVPAPPFGGRRRMSRVMRTRRSGRGSWQARSMHNK